MTHQPQKYTQKVIKRSYLHADLTHRIIGCLFDVFKELSFGYREVYYQRALEADLQNKRIKYEKEKCFKIEFKGRTIGRHFVDFLVEDKVVLELKVANDFYNSHVSQLLSYVKHAKLEIGLLAIITQSGIKIKRLINSV